MPGRGQGREKSEKNFLHSCRLTNHPLRKEVTMFTDFEVIHTYTHAQAIEDGVLVDVSDLARQAGFT